MEAPWHCLRLTLGMTPPPKISLMSSPCPSPPLRAQPVQTWETLTTPLPGWGQSDATKGTEQAPTHLAPPPGLAYFLGGPWETPKII